MCDEKREKVKEGKEISRFRAPGYCQGDVAEKLEKKVCTSRVSGSHAPNAWVQWAFDLLFSGCNGKQS